MRFVFFALAACIVAACSHPPDEMRIRTAIEQMRNAAEARRPAGIIEHIASDFTGNSGEADREALSRLLKIQFLRSDAVGVETGPIEIVIDGDRATAKFEITISDGARRWLPSGRETYAIVSGWRREGSDWLCYNATWSNGDR